MMSPDELSVSVHFPLWAFHLYDLANLESHSQGLIFGHYEEKRNLVVTDESSSTEETRSFIHITSFLTTPQPLCFYDDTRQLNEKIIDTCQQLAPKYSRPVGWFRVRRDTKPIGGELYEHVSSLLTTKLLEEYKMPFCLNLRWNMTDSTRHCNWAPLNYQIQIIHDRLGFRNVNLKILNMGDTNEEAYYMADPIVPIDAVQNQIVPDGLFENLQSSSQEMVHKALTQLKSAVENYQGVENEFIKGQIEESKKVLIGRNEGATKRQKQEPELPSFNSQGQKAQQPHVQSQSPNRQQQHKDLIDMENELDDTNAVVDTNSQSPTTSPAVSSSPSSTASTTTVSTTKTTTTSISTTNPLPIAEGGKGGHQQRRRQPPLQNVNKNKQQPVAAEDAAVASINHSLAVDVDVVVPPQPAVAAPLPPPTPTTQQQNQHQYQQSLFVNDNSFSQAPKPKGTSAGRGRPRKLDVAGGNNSWVGGFKNNNGSGVGRSAAAATPNQSQQQSHDIRRQQDQQHQPQQQQQWHQTNNNISSRGVGAGGGSIRGGNYNQNTGSSNNSNNYRQQNNSLLHQQQQQKSNLNNQAASRSQTAARPASFNGQQQQPMSSRGQRPPIPPNKPSPSSLSAAVTSPSLNNRPVVPPVVAGRNQQNASPSNNIRKGRPSASPRNNPNITGNGAS